jgi:transcriptional regulator with XRE-family HTH domain
MTPAAERQRLIEIGSAIEAALGEAGMSLQDLAAALNKSYQGVRFWIKGERAISVLDLERVAQLLDKPLDYFLKYKSGARPAPPLPRRKRTTKAQRQQSVIRYIRETLRDLAACGFKIIPMTGPDGKPGLKYADRLFARLVSNADDDFYFDKACGGFTNMAQLINLVYDYCYEDIT